VVSVVETDVHLSHWCMAVSAADSWSCMHNNVVTFLPN